MYLTKDKKRVNTNREQLLRRLECTNLRRDNEEDPGHEGSYKRGRDEG